MILSGLPSCFSDELKLTKRKGKGQRRRWAELRVDYRQNSQIVLRKQSGSTAVRRIGVAEQACGHLRRQVCLNNRKRAQMRAGCASDTVRALTFCNASFV